MPGWRVPTLYFIMVRLYVHDTAITGSSRNSAYHNYNTSVALYVKSRTASCVGLLVLITVVDLQQRYMHVMNFELISTLNKVRSTRLESMNGGVTICGRTTRAV